MSSFGIVLTSVASLSAAGFGWVGLNFFGAPIRELRETRREALKVLERYKYVGIRYDTVLVNDTGLVDLRPQHGCKTNAHGALNDVSSSLQTHIREHALATRIYCWALGYDLDFAAQALLTLSEAVQGVHQDPKARRLTLHTLFVAFGAAHGLSLGEIAAARAETRKWHDCNRDMTKSSSLAGSA